MCRVSHIVRQVDPICFSYADGDCIIQVARLILSDIGLMTEPSKNF